ncbi:uncharacterized protein LOC131614456 [Vicia villosa]|uniref:uncharacterized protein LOC131614456 n=1 Tax=Vicia villosa TaxID=3911 RepID=UPI00273ADCBA|nr:uncharacterized protein LOC131614456 [Vicia villosa]
MNNSQERVEHAANVGAAAVSPSFNTDAAVAASEENRGVQLSNSGWSMGHFHSRQADLRETMCSADVLRADRHDTTTWTLEENGIFTVSSCCNFLKNRRSPLGPANRFDSVFKDIWKAEVPIKVKAFGWRSFLNKIPTKDSLLKRGIIISLNANCVLCEETSETLTHSLLRCRYVDIVWKEMAEWIGMTYSCIEDLKKNFLFWSDFCRSKKVKKGKEGTIWLVILWSIWLRRNVIVFNNSSWNSRDVVWSCKALIWRWSYIGKITRANCNFYEFSNNPLFYLS